MKDAKSLSNELQMSMFNTVTKSISDYVVFLGTDGLGIDRETRKVYISLKCMTAYNVIDRIFNDLRFPKQAFLDWLESYGWTLKGDDISKLIAIDNHDISFKDVCEEKDIK